MKVRLTIDYITIRCPDITDKWLLQCTLDIYMMYAVYVSRKTYIFVSIGKFRGKEARATMERMHGCYQQRLHQQF